MIGQFNLGLNESASYALFCKGRGLTVCALAALLNYSSNYAAMFSLNVQGCVCSCLDSCEIGAVPLVSATHVCQPPHPAAPSINSPG